MARVFLLLISILAAEVYGFAPILSPSRAVVSPAPSRVVLRMVESEKTEEAEEKVPVVSVDGTYFDDEVEPAPKIGISDGMRERLMREAGTGLDPDRKQNNVILYIMVGVAVLVVAGGAGIFY